MTAAKQHAQNLVFIGGLHRSGTSLLFQCLREHPQLSGFHDTGVPEDEGQHLQSVYRPASQLGGPGRFGFNSRAHLTEDSELVSDENRAKLLDEWQPHWDLSKSWLLEKTPQNLLHSRFLQALFPAARFIVVQRHPIAVSYATRRWSRTSLHSLMEHWLHCHTIFAQDQAHLTHVLVIRYEEFVAKPAEALERVHRYLEIEPHPTTLQIRDTNDKYFRLWRQDRSSRLSQAYIRGITGRFEAHFKKFGYSLDRSSDALTLTNMNHVPEDDAVSRGGLVTAPVTAAYRSAAFIRHAGFRTYKQLRRAARRLTGRQRCRRPAVDDRRVLPPPASSRDAGNAALK